ncbi:hypothetical protein Pmani_032007 [Petrolisthes manimaculis]|uniref:Protein kinase domain-containing protein n=1 Tax=Petrolisthes manimaculis TaxID=1843537 RepID=A0AAE1NU79_9EUCA|nr:hypothetical protein Pmani_032007 [Petrolisthes manimaculis]
MTVTLVGFGRQCRDGGTFYHAYHHNRQYAPYPSPELVGGGRSITHASDVYSFAQVLQTAFRGHQIGYITKVWTKRVLNSDCPQDRPSLEELRKLLEPFYRPQP